MTADFPELTLMENTRKDVWRRILRFIEKMTSGIVYSIVMHYVIISAYAFLIIHFFHTNEFNLQRLIDVCVPIIFTYGLVSLGELGLRWFDHDDKLLVIKCGHIAHFVGSFFFDTYMLPLSQMEGLLVYSFGALLYIWTLLAALTVAILAMMGEDLLIQPLLD